MKRILSILLCVVMVLSALTLVSCNKAEKNLKLGMGTYSVATKATNADGDTNGSAEAEITVAAVLVDDEGKIVKCVIDTAQNAVAYTSAGKAIAQDSFQTKYEKGDDYNMVAWGGAVQEWYKQADAFDAACIGKTASEITALLRGSLQEDTDLTVMDGGQPVYYYIISAE